MKKEIITLGLISIMTMSMVACGNDEEKDSNKTTSPNTTISGGEETTVEEDTTKNKVDNTDELTDEYLLSLPETPADQFRYEEIEGGIKITSCRVKSDQDTIIVIPNQIDGKDVVELDYELFARDKFKAVVLNKNLKETSGSLFFYSKIDKIVMQEGLEVIGGRSFYFAKVEERVTLPSTIKIIEGTAFGNSNIKEIIIPKNVETIMVGAFSLCNELDTITFEGTPNIENGAFSMSDNIKKVICLDGNITFHEQEFYVTSGEQRDITFVAPAGSKVEQYAKDRGFKFEILE